MTNLKPVDLAIVGGGWSGLALAKEITTRSGLNVVVLEKKLRPEMQLLIVEGATRDIVALVADKGIPDGSKLRKR